MSFQTGQPWGLSLVTDRLPLSPPAYARVELDPATQQGVYLDQDGRAIDMAEGKHGTNRTKATATQSTQGDSNRPVPETNDDSTSDYESD